jgi:hypothetical protein
MNDDKNCDCAGAAKEAARLIVLFSIAFLFNFWLLFIAVVLAVFATVAISGIVAAIERACGVVFISPLQAIERALGAFGQLLPGPRPVRGLIGVALFLSLLMTIAVTFGHAPPVR